MNCLNQEQSQIVNYMQHSNVIHIFSLLYCNFKKSILSEMYTSVCFISALLSNLELSCDILFKSLGDVWQ